MGTREQSRLLYEKFLPKTEEYLNRCEAAGVCPKISEFAAEIGRTIRSFSGGNRKWSEPLVEMIKDAQAAYRSGEVPSYDLPRSRYKLAEPVYFSTSGGKFRVTQLAVERRHCYFAGEACLCSIQVQKLSEGGWRHWFYLSDDGFAELISRYNLVIRPRAAA